MKFLNIEEEISFSEKMFVLRKEIEDLLFNKGYIFVEPSIFEKYDEFTSINTRINNKSTVKVLDNSGEILILSPDITTGIVNKFVPRWQNDTNLKLFYYGKTYKHNGVGIRENREIGVELIGYRGRKTDEDTIKNAVEILSKYTNDYLIEINNNKYLKEILLLCNLSKKENNEILNFLYYKNKEGLREYLNNIKSFKCNVNYINTLENILELEGDLEYILNKIELLSVYKSEVMDKVLNELKVIDKEIKKITKNVTYDLSMVSELNYYDGIFFKGFVMGYNTPIMSGGRYDSFTTQYGKEIPAIGFTIELDELIKIYNKEK